MANHWVASANIYLNLWKTCCCFFNGTYSVDTTHHSWSICLLFQVYWLAPMCGGIAAALIYDFLLCPRSCNLSRRRHVLFNGPEDENDAAETTREGNSSPGPSQWPKWASCCDTQLSRMHSMWFVIDMFFSFNFLYHVFSIYDKRNLFFFLLFWNMSEAQINAHSYSCLTSARVTRFIFRCFCPCVLSINILYMLYKLLFHSWSIGRNPKYGWVVKQQKDVNEVIAHESTLHTQVDMDKKWPSWRFPVWHCHKNVLSHVPSRGLRSPHPGLIIE